MEGPQKKKYLVRRRRQKPLHPLGFGAVTGRNTEHRAFHLALEVDAGLIKPPPGYGILYFD